MAIVKTSSESDLLFLLELPWKWSTL